jgi:uncharacterized membrane protein YczE
MHVSPVVTRLALIASLLAILPFLGGRVDPKVLLVPATFGPMVSLALTLLPSPGPLGLRAASLALGVLLCGVGLAVYVAGQVLIGPADEVCALLAARRRRPLWQARVAVEGSVLVAGFLVGGTVGIGTAVYALCSGPVMHATLGFLTPRSGRGSTAQSDAALAGGTDG